jgi:predicted Ser/Thr protein kinase
MTIPDSTFIALQAALAGEYSLDREIGRGGMGVVYLAREVALARPVAIKVLPPALAQKPALRTAFLAEAQTVARLNHPNIVPVYAAGERNGFAFIVMAYVDGVTLGERIRTRGPLLPGQAARVLREVAWALAYAHGAGIVHRDVSAENIMLERGTERAIVTDFGIASAMQTAAMDAEGRVIGNAYYVSPEQAAGEPLDARSDLYSLGIAGFYALTGRLPFEGETSGDLVTQHLTKPAPAITSVTSSVPPRLAAAVERCLHKEPIRRYRNAESFAEAIDLAFEHAKDIPAPLRSWITQGEREAPAQVAMIGMGAVGGVVTATALGSPAVFLLPFAITTLLSLVPWTQRTRRILGEGYLPEDFQAALREHQLGRAEELEYERRATTPLAKRVMRIMFGVSLGMVPIGIYLEQRASELVLLFSDRTQPGTVFEAVTSASNQGFLIGVLGVTGMTIAGIPLFGEFVRYRLAARVAASRITFWKKWGSRVARIVGVGLKPATRPALGMPVLTEVALGRATDHLFDALPRETRKQLAPLPATVRRLEHDAGQLRDSIDKLDDQLAAFERGSDGLSDVERDTVSAELRVQRGRVAERLTATVAAIENIRLDLLRLQMGSASVQSVTASLDAAREIGEQIAISIQANAEIEALLRGQTESEDAVVNDSDTPVGGVTAARG